MKILIIHHLLGPRPTGSTHEDQPPRELPDRAIRSQKKTGRGFPRHDTPPPRELSSPPIETPLSVVIIPSFSRRALRPSGLHLRPKTSTHMPDMKRPQTSVAYTLFASPGHCRKAVSARAPSLTCTSIPSLKKRNPLVATVSPRFNPLLTTILPPGSSSPGVTGR